MGAGQPKMAAQHLSASTERHPRGRGVGRRVKVRRAQTECIQMDINPPAYSRSTNEPVVAPYPHEAIGTLGANVNGANLNGIAHATPDELGAKAALSFLERLHPTTLWALASFGPGGNEVG